MNCPSCAYTNYRPDEVCPACQFEGETKLITELDHIDWLLTEMESWSQTGLAKTVYQGLQKTYTARQYELEVALNLRWPPFTPTEAPQAWLELSQRQTLLEKLQTALNDKILYPYPTQNYLETLQDEIAELEERLADNPSPTKAPSLTEQLALTNFILEYIDRLIANNAFTSAQAAENTKAVYLTQKANLEKDLGLVPENLGQVQAEVALASQTADPSPAIPLSETETVPETEAEPALPPEPKIPLRDRFWQTVLSEQTLQAILFLGAFLLFAAGVSFVVLGWQNFSPPMRVAIPTQFHHHLFCLWTLYSAQYHPLPFWFGMECDCGPCWFPSIFTPFTPIFFPAPATRLRFG